MSLMLNTGAMQYKADGSSGWQPLTLIANVDLASLADEFSTSATYAVGEYVRRGGVMYRCTTAVTTAGAWDASDWTEVNIGDELESLKTTITNGLSNVKSDIGIVEDGNTATHAIAKGQYVIWKDALYTASQAIPIGTTLSNSNLTAVTNGGLNDLKTVKTGSISAATGFTVGEPIAKQVGNVVWVKFYANKTSGTVAKDSEVHIATVSGVDLRDAIIRFSCGCGSAAYYAYNACYGIMSSSNGKISICPSVAASSFVVDMTYIVD